MMVVSTLGNQEKNLMCMQYAQTVVNHKPLDIQIPPQKVF